MKKRNLNLSRKLNLGKEKVGTLTNDQSGNIIGGATAGAQCQSVNNQETCGRDCTSALCTWVTLTPDCLTAATCNGTSCLTVVCG